MQRRSTARRALPALFLSLLAILGGGLPSSAQEELRPEFDEPVMSNEAERVVAGALRWLKDQQNRDGSWSARIGFKINDGYRLEPQGQGAEGLPHLGVTSLAAMAMLSGGHTPGHGPYGQVVEDALRFVISKVSENGFITANGTRMYSHALSLLFLAEVYGMTGQPQLRACLDRAVEFTHRSQNQTGGWRYAPLARDSDMSITVCQVVALREARNIGIRVPKATIDSALKYVMESAVTRDDERGSFLYQHQDVPFNRNSFALTAAGLTTIYQAGLYSDRDIDAYCDAHGIEVRPRIKQCLAYLWRWYRPLFNDYSNHYFYYYGNYYAAQAMYTRGGEDWRRWYAMVSEDLLRTVNKGRPREGQGAEERFFWRDNNVGETFATAIASIILQVPNHYLPIFQR